MNAFWNDWLMALFLALLIVLCTLAVAVPLLKREHQRALARLQTIIDQRTQALQRLEAAMDDTMQSAYSAKAVKSRFLALLSRELLIPLNLIFSQLAQLQQTKVSHLQRGPIGRIYQHTRLLNTLLGDVLHYADLRRKNRPAGGLPAGALRGGALPTNSVHASSGVFALRETLDTLVGLLQDEAALKKLPIVVIVDSAVPDTLMGNVACYRQVVLRLLANAVRWAEVGTISVQVTLKASGTEPESAASGAAVSADKDQLMLCTRVLDAGSGISPVDSRSIFKPFTQGVAAPEEGTQHGPVFHQRGGRGLGLGLSIARMILAQAGGRIHCENVRLQGVDFVFTQPFTVPTSIAPSASQRRAAGAQGGQGKPQFAQESLQAIKVLLVEPASDTRAHKTALLEAAGYGVLPVARTAQALAACAACEVDGVVLNHESPGIAVVEVARRLRSHPGLASEVPIVVFVSGGITPAEEHQYRTAGVDEIIPVPLDVRGIRRVMERGLRSRPPTGNRGGKSHWSH